MFKNRKVLVTGAVGVIGRELVELLKSAQAQIRVVDLVEKPEVFGKDIEYFRCDLSDPEAQFLFRFEPDYVFHLAADFERSREDTLFWDSNFLNNVLASHYLLREVVKHRSLKKIIFASSYLIYDKKLYHNTAKANMITEKFNINPRNLCGIAKLQTERDIEFFHTHADHKFDYACARIFRVYGKGSRDIISRWVRGALRGEVLEVFDADNAFDYIHARDVAIGLLKMAERKEAVGIINLGTGRSNRIAEIAAIIKKCIPKTRFKTISSSIYRESSYTDVVKLKKLTGWHSTITLEEGIKEIIAYEKKNIN